MRQEVAWRLPMLLALWSILVISLGTGFPTRHKNVGHKVSFLQISIMCSATGFNKLRSIKITPAADKTVFFFVK